MSETIEPLHNLEPRQGLEHRIDALAATVERQAALGRQVMFVLCILVSLLLGLGVVFLFVLCGALR